MQWPAFRTSYARGSFEFFCVDLDLDLDLDWGGARNRHILIYLKPTDRYRCGEPSTYFIKKSRALARGGGGDRITLAYVGRVGNPPTYFIL